MYGIIVATHRYIGHSVLSVAVNAGNQEIVRQLVEAGAIGMETEPAAS